ncbi:MAG: hypothetical protein ACJ763_08550 [Bdellovibrionia bacterium]
MKPAIFRAMILVIMAHPCVASPKTAVTQIKIETRSIKDKLCGEMDRFDSKHVREFFEKAKAISSAELHDFEQLDCHVKGSLKRGKSEFNFDIQPIGLGSLTDKKSGKVQWFGCKSCDNLFPPQADK